MQSFSGGGVCKRLASAGLARDPARPVAAGRGVRQRLEWSLERGALGRLRALLREVAGARDSDGLLLSALLCAPLSLATVLPRQCFLGGASEGHMRMRRQWLAETA